MPLIEQLSRLRSNLLSEEQEFAQHIRQWFPISISIGIVVGLAMSLFTIFTSFIAALLGGILPLIAMLIGGLIVWGLIKVGWEDTTANGISFVISKKHERKGIPLSQTSEFVASGVAIGSGLPVGREGPALIIGSALATKISKWGNIPEDEIHEAITIGSAAATGALFQAPFGSAVFAAEVPYKEDSDEPMLMVSFLASVVAAVTLRTVINLVNSWGFVVDLHLFRIGDAVLQVNIINSILAFLLGLIIGLLSRSVIEFYYRYKNIMMIKFSQHQRTLIGLIISLTSLLIGYLLIEDFYLARGISSFDHFTNFIGVSSPSNLLFILVGALIIQIIATIAIIAVGFPGGIFSPTLAVGAIVGIIYATVIGIADPFEITAFAIVGMSASHAAFTKTPIASILLVLEITNLPSLIIPIILANISSYVISGHRSLYQGQIRSRDAILLKQLAEYDQFQEVTIEQVMTPNEKVIVASPDTVLSEINQKALESGKRTFPVMNENIVVGIVSYNDIRDGLTKNKELVKDVMTSNVISVKKKMTSREALYHILQNDIERAPVVDDENRLEGIVTMHDILLGHQKLIDLNKTLGRL